MKSEAELKAVTQFVAEYATRLMGSGVHTSRVVRNTKRLGEALGVRVMVSAFQKVVTLSLIHISEPTRPYEISYAVFCLKKFFFNDTATTEIYTRKIVGSVRCV